MQLYIDARSCAPDLYAAFENGEKSEKDISLVVAWEIGSEWKKRYQVTSLLDLTNIQHRPFHGITHIFREENSGHIRFYGIILSDLLEYLDNVEDAQAVQTRNRREQFGAVAAIRFLVDNRRTRINKGAFLNRASSDQY